MNENSKTQRSLHRFLNKRYLAILTFLVLIFVVAVFFLRHSAMDDTTDYYLFYDAQVMSEFYQINDEIVEFDLGIKEYYWGVSRLPEHYQKLLGLSKEDPQVKTNETYIYQYNNKFIYILPYLAVDKGEVFFVIHLFDIKNEAMFYQSWQNTFVLLATLGLLLVIFYSLYTNRQISRQMTEFHQWVKSVEHLNYQQLQQQSLPKTLTFEELVDSAQGLQNSIATQYQLQQNQQALLEREKHFLSSLSHELRTPIAIISAAVTLLKKSDKLLPKDIAKLDKLNNANLSMKQLSHTLLQLWRGQKSIGNSEHQTQPLVDKKIFLLDELIEQAITHCQQQFKRKNIVIELIIHEPIKLLAQYEFTEILINNLLRNACQYTTDARVKATLFKHYFLIENSVENSHLSDQSDNTPPERDEYDHGYGYGLGLFLAEKICQQMQWQLKITSPKQKFSVKVMFDNIVE